MENETYKEAYLLMVRSSEKALRAMERQNFGAAWDALIEAQRKAEELLLQEAS